jgi:[NiFe] hydrogenase assembly HybE family chaperone
MSDAVTLLPDPSTRLEEAFRVVHAQRMLGLPFLNPAISVEAIAFAPWKGCWLGVMLTPWSMNLLLTPRDSTAWRPLPLGAKRRYTFPAGDFDFISAEAEAIGDYMTCSLFSPVLEFADHETARRTAVLAREALLDPENAECGSSTAPGLRSDAASAATLGVFSDLEAKLTQQVSRRDLLHGRLARSDDAPRR